jgi:FkbM family methyltransferase
MELEKNKVFVQIGTNDGNDHFKMLVSIFHPSKVVLVEPNRQLFLSIATNYNMLGIPNVFIENVAITNIPQGLVQLVIPDINQHNGNRYHSGHFTLLPMADWGVTFSNTITASSMTFTELCDKHDLQDIHYLQIDTEGYDYEIIKSIDFDKINIDVLRYEVWDFPESAYSNYGDSAKQYGINGMRQVEKLLTERGYTLKRMNHDIIATK